MVEISNSFIRIFYDPQEEGVDFLILDGEGNIIPIEVGYEKKINVRLKRQLKNIIQSRGNRQ
ncbi:MAG: hypothetical protein QMD06_04205 [Candidatus Altarchaeum sp.]|nr:hypothetical protein [Candidatus Altarchaeum sp.]